MDWWQDEAHTFKSVSELLETVGGLHKDVLKVPWHRRELLQVWVSSRCLFSPPCHQGESQREKSGGGKVGGVERAMESLRIER